MTGPGSGPDDGDRVREALAASIGGVQRGAAADQLCRSFVGLLDVDGAALTVLLSPTHVTASLGTSGPLPHQLMELQFMLGEGPCPEALASSAPVLAADLDPASAARWPQFAAAASELGVQAAFAFPVTLAGFPIGALFLHRNRAGPLSGVELAGAFFAADLAVIPILDLLSVSVDDHDDPDRTGSSSSELATLNRPEVYQATGVLVAQLRVTPAEALVRLRAHAYSQGTTVSETAYDILEHRVRLEDDRTDDTRPQDDLG